MTTAAYHIFDPPDWETLFPGSVFFDELGAAHTSMGVGGKIDMLFRPQTLQDLSEMVRLLNRKHIAYAVVGNWTNLIITGKGFRGCLICTQKLNRLHLLPVDNGAMVTAEAGVSLAELVSITVRENLDGFTFGAGIPGSVGGAVRMNAGAYGHSISELIQSVTMMDCTGALATEEKSTLHFAYRNFNLPEGSVIVEATFLLKKDPAGQISVKVREILEERRRKHPLQYRNAGSIFKNPPERPAGRLIEEGGLKGFSIGGAMVSEEHGNFIVNRGQATADDVLAVMRYVQKRIAQDKGVSLELEVKILGEG